MTQAGFGALTEEQIAERFVDTRRPGDCYVQDSEKYIAFLRWLVARRTEERDTAIYQAVRFALEIGKDRTAKIRAQLAESEKIPAELWNMRLRERGWH